MGKAFDTGMGPAGAGVATFTKAITDGIDKALGPVSAKVKTFGKELVDDITKPLTDATAAVTSFGPKFLAGFQALQQALAIAKTFGPAVVSQIKGALDSIGNITKAFAPGFVTSFGKIDDALKHVQSFATTMKAGIDTPLNNALTKAGQFGSKVQSDIIGKMQDADAAVKKFSTSMDQLANPITKAASAVLGFAPAILAGMTALQNADDQVKAFGPDFTENIQDVMDAAVSAIAPLMDTFSQKMKNGMNDLNNADNAMKTFSNDITSNLITKLQNAITMFANFHTALSNDFLNPINSANGSMSTFTGSLTTIANDINGIQTAITSVNFSSLVTAVQNLPGQITSPLSGLIGPGGQMYQIGQQIISGLVAGIGNQVGTVAAAAANAAQTVVNTAKQVTGTHSPSTVFMEIGSWLMEGLAHGIATGAGNPTTTMQQVLQTITSAGGTKTPLPGQSGYSNGSFYLPQGQGNPAAGQSGAGTTIQLAINGEAFANATLKDLQTVAMRNQKTGGQYQIQLS